ncbi:MAG: hypothetical protein G01um10143_531 [Parcubacteria group bacterium Gr01-1014_3]|nr:MAG: hypothetical protein G01um10143_531 [Parcubacteria group bacterium Gr01-1014_3]
MNSTVEQKQQSRPSGSRILDFRSGQVLYDKKWEKFLRRSWLFGFTPFCDFALAAGSMAVGNVGIDSDFDVIVGARSGRIFTARFFAVIFFGLFGWRRKKLSHRESAADKICLNHFVTEQSFKLSPPYDAYWQNLYSHLVPIFGPVGKINQFFKANAAWLATGRIYEDDLRHLYRKNSLIKSLLEFLMSGKSGNWLEALLKRLQVKRIEKSLESGVPGYQPRIIYNDTELEFHPDTRRAAEFATLAKKPGGDNV